MRGTSAISRRSDFSGLTCWRMRGMSSAERSASSASLSPPGAGILGVEHLEVELDILESGAARPETMEQRRRGRGRPLSRPGRRVGVPGALGGELPQRAQAARPFFESAAHAAKLDLQLLEARRHLEGPYHDPRVRGA